MPRNVARLPALKRTKRNLPAGQKPGLGGWAAAAPDGLRLEHVALSQLLRAPRNPKRHDLGALRQSLGRFGYVAPVIVDESTGRLVAGPRAPRRAPGGRSGARRRRSPVADTVSARARSALMARIRGDDLGPERRLRAALAGLGAPFVANDRALPGRPDAVVGGRLAVFVHGCFWHACPRHWRLPATRRAFWSRKAAGNARRDARVRRALNRAGLSVMAVWEHSLATEAGAARVARLVAERAGVRG